MSEKENQIKRLIERCTSHLFDLIDVYEKYNQPPTLISSDLSEVIHAACYGTICGGSGGGGWDHVDYGEDKSSSHVQSKACKGCKKKVTFFSSKCPHCGSQDFKKNPRDGRWSISSKSHISYAGVLKEYRLFLIEPTTDEASCRSFRIRHWVIAPDSEHLTRYALAQYKSLKSNLINFQPLRCDFYLSKPCLRYDGILTLQAGESKVDFTYFDLENEIPETVPEKFQHIISENLIAKKNFGKERGQWVRN